MRSFLKLVLIVLAFVLTAGCIIIDASSGR